METTHKKGSWIRNSATVKLLTITVLMLLLLIPASMIQSIIQERERRNLEAVEEVSKRWASAQEIKGPILTIPFRYVYEEKGKTKTATKHWYLLPENLTIHGKILPKKLQRGIYDVIVYNSDLSLSGKFILKKPPMPGKKVEILYDQAFLTVGISDLRGIKDKIRVNWNAQTLDVEPGSNIAHQIQSGVTIALPDLAAKKQADYKFDFKLNLQGSKTLNFVPVGSTTVVKLTSPWQSPSFNGNFLPANRELTKEGFYAEWKVLELNRNFPQTWVDKSQYTEMGNAVFGVDFILPLDDYQKSMRSAKYAVMTIALTFLIFFLVEVLYKKKIHPLQYALVGLALVLFYILLVSITEHLNFNIAYGISTVAIVLLISFYSISIFHDRKLSIMLLTTISAVYAFLFVTLQLVDYALLMGSLGLLLMLGATMYFTRNIDWYQLNLPGGEE
ncbi:MAG: cell envelope integrity protein CreD [Bacteroidales bacterium]